jgi:MFS family permease
VRVPLFYGWVVVAVAFVTMGVGVNARTAFSLLFPPILDEFAWERGVTAGAFSFGFLVSGVLSPFLGRLMDRRGPRVVMEMGVGLMAAGLMLAQLVREPWHLYATLGVLVGGGSICLSYTGQALYLPNWFVRRRGLAMSVAYSGVGVGSIILLPWVQSLIERAGWRAACLALGILTLGLLAPLNLMVRRGPEDLGLAPDGDRPSRDAAASSPPTNVVDPVWAAVDWTVGRALHTARFWWIAGGYFCAMFAWYAVQVVGCLPSPRRELTQPPGRREQGRENVATRPAGGLAEVVASGRAPETGIRPTRGPSSRTARTSCGGQTPRGSTLSGTAGAGSLERSTTTATTSSAGMSPSSATAGRGWSRSGRGA